MNYEVDDGLFDAAELRRWLLTHPECPRCGANLKTQPPDAELWPHFTGSCKRAGEL